MTARVIIRVVIPECTLEEAAKITHDIAEVVRKMTDAIVELSTTSVRAR